MPFRLLRAASALALVMAAGSYAAGAAPADQPGHQSPSSGTSSETASKVKDTTAEAVGVISAEMTTTTKGFVAAAAISDLYEVEAGQIAERRGQSDAVRDFSKHMVEAHIQTADQLKTVLAGNNVDVGRINFDGVLAQRDITFGDPELRLLAFPEIDLRVGRVKYIRLRIQPSFDLDLHFSLLYSLFGRCFQRMTLCLVC